MAAKDHSHSHPPHGPHDGAAHGHAGHDHAHHHHGDAHHAVRAGTASQSRFRSLIALSGPQRLVLVLPMIVGLWAMAFWAMGWFG